MWKTFAKGAWIKGNHNNHSERNLWRPGSLGPSPVNAFEQHRKLRTRQTNSSALDLRPDEPATLQSLGKQAQSVTIEPQKFNDVATAPPENKDMSGERLLLKHRLHLRTQTIEVGKRASLLTLPPLRTGHESFPSSGSSHV